MRRCIRTVLEPKTFPNHDLPLSSCRERKICSADLIQQGQASTTKI